MGTTTDDSYRADLVRCYLRIAAATRYLAVAADGATTARPRLYLLLELAESAQSLILALVDVTAVDQRGKALFDAERAAARSPEPSCDEFAARWAITCGEFASVLRKLITAAPERDRRLLEAVHRHTQHFFAVCQADSAPQYADIVSDFLARQELHLPLHLH